MKQIAGKNNVFIFDSIDELSAAVCDDLRDSIEKTGQRAFNVALSGGETPEVIYKRLSMEPYATEIPFERVHFFWGDERCVPPDHPESNYMTASDSLLGKIPVSPNNIHRIRGEAEPKTEAARYEEEVKRTVPIVDGFPRFDWIFLGLGGDGHTASLFPGSDSLAESSRVFVATTGPQYPQRRITVTLPVINNAVRVVFLVTGAGKSSILSDIIGEGADSARFPAGRIAPANGELVWFVDHLASSGISS